MKVKTIVFLLLFISVCKAESFALLRDSTKVPFFRPSESLKPQRYWGLVGTGVVTYGVFSYGLYNSWYKNEQLGDFRLFNDGGEWLQMDKAGHVFSAYFQSAYAYQISRWTGQTKAKSLLTSAIVSTTFQTTLEIFDGYAEKWGFSWYDVAANTAGTAVFQVQQMIWDKQYVSLKEFAKPSNYEDPILETRADNLYGNIGLARMLKDYNTQTYWASLDVKSISGSKVWPKWLNIGIGYGAENMWGGYENTWTEKNGQFRDYTNLPRLRQYYLGADLNLKSFNPKSATLKSILNALDIFKLPLPGVRYDRQNGLTWMLFAH